MPRRYGSNRCFYDVVHGISVMNGVRIQDLHFDVTTEVNGRSNSVVVTEALTSSLP